jgi:hypothetical protein
MRQPQLHVDSIHLNGVTCINLRPFAVITPTPTLLPAHHSVHTAAVERGRGEVDVKSRAVEA